eukprot:8267748-Karenia_brevis.AAC.1
MSSSFSVPWWHHDALHLGSFDQLPHSVKSQMGVTADTLDTQFKEWVDSFHQPYAKSAFMEVARQHQHHDLHIKDLCRVHAVAPDTPNVYTDGSLTSSTHIGFALSSASVWWPDRQEPL